GVAPQLAVDHRATPLAGCWPRRPPVHRACAARGGWAQTLAQAVPRWTAQLAQQLVAGAYDRDARTLALEVPALPVRRPVFVDAGERDAQEDVGVQPLRLWEARERVDELCDRAAAETDQCVRVEIARRVGGQTRRIEHARDVRAGDERRRADRVRAERAEDDREREWLQRIRHPTA